MEGQHIVLVDLSKLSKVNLMIYHLVWPSVNPLLNSIFSLLILFILLILFFLLCRLELTADLIIKVL
jgi:hypothetical protein